MVLNLPDVDMRNRSLATKISARIVRSRRIVFVRSDFSKLGGYDQVGRALRALVDQGVVIKIGYGLYAKARSSSLTGRSMIAAPGGFTQAAREALTRLGVDWSLPEAEQDYQDGSTQVPANAGVIIKDRFSRRIATGKFELRTVRA